MCRILPFRKKESISVWKPNHSYSFCLKPTKLEPTTETILYTPLADRYTDRKKKDR